MADLETAQDLADFVTSVAGDAALRVEERLGHGFVRLRVAEAERRQAAHDIRFVEDAVVELLRNARDAGAHDLYVATTREGDRRIVCVIDDGEGIPAEMRELVFEPRVTSKLESVHMDRWGVHGRGMALYSIRENATVARVAASVPGGGTAMLVEADTARLPERADQSTWPRIEEDEQGEAVVGSGPHNIIRCCCEFALEETGRCRVFFGSPSEIVATMRSRGLAGQGLATGLLTQRLEDLPIVQRFAVASDAQELAQAAVACGLEVSQRTMQRVIAGQIDPVPAIGTKLRRRRSRPRGIDLTSDRRGLRLSTADLQEFKDLLERDFSLLAERYYLTLKEAPRIRVSGNRMTVTFDYEGQD